jgi:GNAT superfamily N-acetyltransferase
VRVREATPKDWPAVAALLSELGRPDVRGDGEDPYRELFADYLRRPDAVALVVEDDGAVVGFVNVEFRSRLNRGTPEAWIPELIVAEGHRSRGAGAALLSRVEDLAAERGCWALSLESANWRTDAHRFYAREGWKDLAAAFHKVPQEKRGSS